jgi:hypothetical protein
VTATVVDDVTLTQVAALGAGRMRAKTCTLRLGVAAMMHRFDAVGSDDKRFFSTQRKIGVACLGSAMPARRRAARSIEHVFCIS